MKRIAALPLLAMLTLSSFAMAEDADSDPPSLPVLNFERDAISVMGVSSGGYMATQLAVAWPERFSGLAVFAAGPWGCAQGSLRNALNRCMYTRDGLPDLSVLETQRARYQAEGQVGSDAALARQRVFIWHGEQDTTIDPRLGKLLAAQYRAWLTDPTRQLRVRFNPEAAHGWPVADDAAPRVPCGETSAPYLLDCSDEDGAGEALAWLYPGRNATITPPAAAATQEGALYEFDQRDFYTGRRLADRGYVYIPQACAQGRPCALMIALHGCNMSSEQIGEAFVRHSGLNRWASRYRLVVLYPQADVSLPNPQGCWDWWGYDESTWQLSPLHDTRDGRQASALKAMVEHIRGESPAGGA
ncbi:extracellular catalytic domain type 2 short-chain-length polyhydroxyalkanoate depolymerase [Halomonas sp. WWR20]